MEENFENTLISRETLQGVEIDPLAFKRPEPAYWKIVVLQYLSFLIFLGVTASFFLLNDWGVSSGIKNTGILLLGLFALWMLFIYRLSYLKKGYQLRTHDVIIRTGSISTLTLLIPINKIQQVNIKEGIWSRMFKLATLNIHTAASVGQAQNQIPGLKLEDAHKIRTLLLSQIKNIDESTWSES